MKSNMGATKSKEVKPRSANVNSLTTDVNNFFFADLPPDCAGTCDPEKYPSYGHICQSEKEYCRQLATPINVPPVVAPQYLSYTPDPPLNVPPSQVIAVAPDSSSITNPINRSGQIALVVGGSKGIGLWTAAALASLGMTVIATSRFPDRHPTNPKPGVTISRVPLDATSAKSTRKFFKKVIKPIGRIDVLVNCANWGYFGFLKDTTTYDFQAQINMTLIAQQTIAFNAVPFMRHSNQTRVITLASLAAEFYTEATSGYAVSKHALQWWNDTWNLEEAIVKSRGLAPAGPFFSLFEPYYIMTTGGVFEYNVPTDQSPESLLVNASKAWQIYNAFAPGNYTTPEHVADGIKAVAISQQPGTRYTVFNPNAVIAGFPFLQALTISHTIPADQLLNTSISIQNDMFGQADMFRQLLQTTQCTNSPCPINNSKCGNRNCNSAGPNCCP